MGIINKKNIQDCLKNPFLFVPLIMLISIALIYSWTFACLIIAIFGIPIALVGKNPSQFINSFCNGNSWKIISMENLIQFLGNNIILILILSFFLWLILNCTKKGNELLALLD